MLAALHVAAALVGAALVAASQIPCAPPLGARAAGLLEAEPRRTRAVCSADVPKVLPPAEPAAAVSVLALFPAQTHVSRVPLRLTCLGRIIPAIRSAYAVAVALRIAPSEAAAARGAERGGRVEGREREGR
eukprot:1138522-Rhodomonas_salina.1